MFIDPEPAPTSPLNLRFGVIYKPRVPTPPFVAYEVTEVQPDKILIRAYDEQGHPERVFYGDINEAYYRMAAHLRMDV